MYEDVDIDLPEVNIKKEDQDPHSKRLQHVCDLEDYDFTDEQIKKARRAYYGAVSYVDDCIGQLLEVLEKCRMAEDTIIIFSGDHGDMLGERGLWYKMSYFESSVRVPMLISHPKSYAPHRVHQNVSTLDILPTLCDLVGTKLVPTLPMDGVSMMPHLKGNAGNDTVFAEYMGEGTVAPLCMIRRGQWKYITCPADPPQLFNLHSDPQELVNLASSTDPAVQEVFKAFEDEARQKWDMASITHDVLLCQRRRRFVDSSLRQGRWEVWDYKVPENSQDKYIRSHMDLDDLELRARFPAVDDSGREKILGKDTFKVPHGQAGAHGE